jgi:hypothetical protein
MNIQVLITSYDDSTDIVLYCSECRLPFKMFGSGVVDLADINLAEQEHTTDHIIQMHRSVNT